MKKPTMRDIAERVGVSAVTVSKALAGKPGMSDAVRRQIEKTAAEMGYRRDEAERGRSGSRLDIGILVPDRYFEPESFYAVLYKRLVQVLAEHGHFALMELLTAEAEEALAMPELLRSGRVSGLILLGQPDKPYCRMITRQPVPVVLLDFYDEQAGADAVVGDNSYGCYRLTSHLIRNGHSEIGFVGNYHATSSIMDRYLGFCRAMLSNDLPIREEWILPDRDIRSTLTELKLPDKLPTAFVCNCDLVARRLIAKLAERGLRVPEDISVTGFDDFETGPEAEPPLSTFRVDTDSMIELAVQLLVQRCAGDRRPFGRTVIGGQPIYRGSEGMPKAQ